MAIEKLKEEWVNKGEPGYETKAVINASRMKKITDKIDEIVGLINNLSLVSNKEHIVGFYEKTDGTKTPIYAKKYDFGTMPNATSKNISTDLLPGQQKVLSVTGHASTNVNDVPIDFSFPTNSVSARSSYDGRYIEITTTANYSIYTANIEIRYIKNS